VVVIEVNGKAPQYTDGFMPTLRLLERSGIVGKGFEVYYGRSHGDMDARITWAVSRIDDQLEAPLDVAGLAAAVNLSPSRFAYLFRREIGTSPARFVKQRRLDRARDLLETTFLSVKEVMASVGFSDASHFTRNFRQHHGLAPREWRQARRVRPR
jgi:transcriptional regulator GlxA family with amidase domain